MNNLKPIIFIVGSTAVGKTDVAFSLAQRIDGEIISCDAMQVYREINIASAKPSLERQERIKHHCLNITSVTEDFNVARFRKVALEAIGDIQFRGKKVVFCGGSGMYMAVLLDGIFEQLSRDPLIREKLQKQAIVSGIGSLHRRLSELDPVVAGKIHPNDAKRIVRALEICITAGVAMSEMQSQRQGLWGEYPIKIFALNRPREELYQRVELRIDQMFENGLVEEIQEILKMDLSVTAKTLIGIPEVGGYLQGNYDLEQAKYLMKLHTRHYVKRQMTWFRRDKRIEWIEMEGSNEEIVEKICQKNVY